MLYVAIAGYMCVISVISGKNVVLNVLYVCCKCDISGYKCVINVL